MGCSCILVGSINRGCQHQALNFVMKALVKSAVSTNIITTKLSAWSSLRGRVFGPKKVKGRLFLDFVWYLNPSAQKSVTKLLRRNFSRAPWCPPRRGSSESRATAWSVWRGRYPRSARRQRCGSVACREYQERNSYKHFHYEDQYSLQNKLEEINQTHQVSPLQDLGTSLR